MFTVVLRKNGRDEVSQCARYTVDHRDDGSATIAMDGGWVSLDVPVDGEAFVMNENGRTVQTIRPKAERHALRGVR